MIIILKISLTLYCSHSLYFYGPFFLSLSKFDECIDFHRAFRPWCEQLNLKWKKSHPPNGFWTIFTHQYIKWCLIAQSKSTQNYAPMLTVANKEQSKVLSLLFSCVHLWEWILLHGQPVGLCVKQSENCGTNWTRKWSETQNRSQFHAAYSVLMSKECPTIFYERCLFPCVCERVCLCVSYQIGLFLVQSILGNSIKSFLAFSCLCRRFRFILQLGKLLSLWTLIYKASTVSLSLIDGTFLFGQTKNK